MPHYIQPSLGGQFFAPFRYEADIVRLNAQSNGQHFVGNGAFKVHTRLQHIAQDFHVPILDVAAVFAQM